MKKRIIGRTGLIVIASVVLLSGGFGIAYATGTIVPSAADTYNGCVANGSGTLRIVSNPSQCHPTESAISLSGPIQAQSTSVDCTNGGSIESAINMAPPVLPLNISVSGTCNESVQINRNDVTLNAVGPTTISPPNSSDFAIIVHGEDVNINGNGYGITLSGGTGLGVVLGGGFFPNTSNTAGGLRASNLTILNSTAGGILVGDGTLAQFENVTITNPANVGVSIGPAAYARFDNSHINNAGFNGIDVADGHLNLGGTTVTHSARFGIDTDGGVIDANSSTIDHSGSIGAFAFNGGVLNLNGSVIDSNQTGVVAQGGGSASIQDTQVTNSTGGPGVVSQAGGRVTIQQSSAVEANAEGGVSISGGGVVAFDSGKIDNNLSGNGITIHDLSIAVFGGGPNEVEGNVGFGIFCTDSQAMYTGSPATVSGNSVSNTSNCTTGS